MAKSYEISIVRKVLRGSHIKGAHRLIKWSGGVRRGALSGLGCLLNFDLSQANELYSYFFMGDDQYIRFWKGTVESGDAFIDVGANVGYYACHLSKMVASSGLVLAFEPNPATRQRLQENLDLNDSTNVLLLDYAVGECARTDVLLASSEHGLSRLRNIRGDNFGIGTVDVEHTVRVVGIDELASRLSQHRVRGMKIDIEGCELSALRGAVGLIRTHHPVIQLEVNLNLMRQFGFYFRDLHAFFADLDYVTFAPEVPTGFVWSKSAVTLKALGTGDDAPVRPADILACHRSDADFVLHKWRNRLQ